MSFFPSSSFFNFPANPPRPRRRPRVLRGLRHLQLLHVSAGLPRGRVRRRRFLLRGQGRRPSPGLSEEVPPSLEDGRSLFPRVPAGGPGLRCRAPSDVSCGLAGGGAGRQRRDGRRRGPLQGRQGLCVGGAGEQRVADLGPLLSGTVLHGDAARVGADQAAVEVSGGESGELVFFSFFSKNDDDDEKKTTSTTTSPFFLFFFSFSIPLTQQ